MSPLSLQLNQLQNLQYHVIINYVKFHPQQKSNTKAK